MAATSLSLQLSDYRDLACAEVFGGTLGYAGLDAGEQAEINRLILRGERTFWLHPPGVQQPHVWSCLRDPGLMDLWQDVAVSSVVAGTVGAGTTTTTFVASTGIFTAAMVGLHIDVTSGALSRITAFTSATTVTVTLVSGTGGAADVGKALTVRNLVRSLSATGTIGNGAVGTLVSTTTLFTVDMVGLPVSVTGGGGPYDVTGFISPTIVRIGTPVILTAGQTWTVAGGLIAGAAVFSRTMIGKTLDLVTDVQLLAAGIGKVRIASVLSPTVITISPNYTVNPSTFTVASGGAYGLPSDFESPESSRIVFAGTSWTPDIEIVDEKMVTSLRATNPSTGYPQYAAIRWASTNGVDPHTQELVIWPDTNANYQVSLPFMVQPTGMTIDTNPYPRGGPEMADCLLSVVLAVCEEAKSGRRGDRWASAERTCGAAAMRDRSRHHNFVAGMMRPDAGSSRRMLDVKSLILPV